MTRIMEENSRFRQLLQAMASGWKIDEPVLLGAMWHPAHNVNGDLYHFVLRNDLEDKTTLLSLPVSPQLHSFLSKNNIQVNCL